MVMRFDIAKQPITTWEEIGGIKSLDCKLDSVPLIKSKIKKPKKDWISVEVREKGFHIISSDWIGEVHIRTRDYLDGKVHQKWFKLGPGAWKRHTRRPRGYIH